MSAIRCEHTTMDSSAMKVLMSICRTSVMCRLLCTERERTSDSFHLRSSTDLLIWHVGATDSENDVKTRMSTSPRDVLHHSHKTSFTLEDTGAERTSLSELSVSVFTNM